MFNNGLDEQFSSFGRSDSLIVVEHQPGVTRPIAKILSENCP
jgi:hypothetical protein